MDQRPLPTQDPPVRLAHEQLEPDHRIIGLIGVLGTIVGDGDEDYGVQIVQDEFRRCPTSFDALMSARGVAWLKCLLDTHGSYDVKLAVEQLERVMPSATPVTAIVRAYLDAVDAEVERLSDRAGIDGYERACLEAAIETTRIFAMSRALYRTRSRAVPPVRRRGASREARHGRARHAARRRASRAGPDDDPGEPAPAGPGALAGDLTGGRHPDPRGRRPGEVAA